MDEDRIINYWLITDDTNTTRQFEFFIFDSIIINHFEDYNLLLIGDKKENEEYISYVYFVEYSTYINNVIEDVKPGDRIKFIAKLDGTYLFMYANGVIKITKEDNDIKVKTIENIDQSLNYSNIYNFEAEFIDSLDEREPSYIFKIGNKNYSIYYDIAQNINLIPNKIYKLKNIIF